MKNIFITLFAISTIVIGCKTKIAGLEEVNTPFKGSKYEGNKRWVRAEASGESMNLETSKDKAMLTAKQRLASSLQTEIKNVTENYKGERQVDGSIGDFNERFQALTREVMSQILVEVQTIDEKIYQNNKKNYITWVALEARKKTIYKKLKEQAKMRQSLSDKDKTIIEKMIDEAIKDLEDDE